MSCSGNKGDVNQTRQRLGISFPMIPAPVTDVIKAYGLSTDRNGTSYGTVIIDKNGSLRLIHNSTSSNIRLSLKEIQETLKEIQP